MKENDTFRMTYSAEQQEEIEAIRQKYAPRPHTAPDKMELLRQMDARVGQKATMVSLIVGIMGTLLLGFGMSMVISEFGALFGTLAMPLGIGSGVVGIIVLALAYPIYGTILRREREKIAPEILRLTDELLH